MLENPDRIGIPAISSAELTRLSNLLRTFEAAYPSSGGDVARFECLLDGMFDAMLQSGGDDRDRAWPLRSSVDNLDSGNAWFPASTRFRERLAAAVSDADALRRYTGPRPIPSLSDSARRWLTQAGVVDAARWREFDVAVGAGTVNLYHAVIRKIVAQAGDALLVPRGSYGFFVPHVERMGGQLTALSRHDWWTDPEGIVGAAVDGFDAGASRLWLATARHRLAVYAADVADQYGCDTGPFLRGAERLVSGLADAHRFRAEDRARLAEISGDLLFGGDRGAFAAAESRPRTRLPSPPRVVGFFLTNPDTLGNVHGRGALARVAETLRRREVALIEDWAYQSLGAEPPRIGTALGLPGQIYLLLGFSKPLGIADCRIGLMVGSAADLVPIFRIVENSIGFVSTCVQSALAAVLSDASALGAECRANWEGGHGYAALRDLAVACFAGCSSALLPAASAPDRRAKVRGELERFLERLSPEAPGAPGRRRRLPDADRVVDSFVEQGLARWFDVVQVPEAGFFLIVDCSPIIRSPPRALAGRLRSSFDVFSALAVLFGVRTIPEECMSDLRFARSRWLRISYSVGEQALLTSLFTVFLGLHELDIDGRVEAP